MERLDEVVIGTGAKTTDLLLDLPLGRQHDDRDVAAVAFLLADLRGDLVAVQLRQHHVEQNEGRILGAPEAEPLRPVGGGDDLVALLLQGVLEQALHVRVVIDHEDLGRHQSFTGLRVGRRAQGA